MSQRFCLRSPPWRRPAATADRRLILLAIARGWTRAAGRWKKPRATVSLVWFIGAAQAGADKARGCRLLSSGGALSCHPSNLRLQPFSHAESDVCSILLYLSSIDAQDVVKSTGFCLFCTCIHRLIRPTLQPVGDSAGNWRRSSSQARRCRIELKRPFAAGDGDGRPDSD